MSDVMLHGVLCMPPELWQDSEIDKWQRYTRYLEASRRIEEQQAEIERLRKRLEIDPRHSYDGISTRDKTIRMQDGEIERLRAEVEALHAALRRYGRHEIQCKFQVCVHACTCGLDEIATQG